MCLQGYTKYIVYNYITVYSYHYTVSLIVILLAMQTDLQHCSLQHTNTAQIVSSKSTRAARHMSVVDTSKNSSKPLSVQLYTTTIAVILYTV